MNATGTMTVDHGTATEGIGGRSLARTAETATSAMQAAATAAIQARFVVAMQRPRSWDDARIRIMNECKRPGFAEVARYRKPIGKGVEGPSIRFAEACLRYAGNLAVETTTTFEDSHKRILHVSAIDYETNASFSADVAITKTVERQNASGRTVVGERLNSRGQTVFLVEATDDEILNLQNALVSKAARTLILRLIPGDIVEEGQALCIDTLQNRAAKDPAGERKRLCDAFARLGVMPSDLEGYVGHALDALQPAEMTELRAVFETIRDGEATWKAIMAERGSGAEGAETKKSTIADKVKAKAAQQRAKAGRPAPTPGATKPVEKSDKPAPVDRAAKTEPAPPSVPDPPAHDPDTGELRDDQGGEVDRGDDPDAY